jgi:protein gp37
MSKTLISWTDETLNPLVGCSKVSEGCTHCYAETAAATPRLQQFPQYQGVIDKHGHWNGTINFVPEQLNKLFHMKKSRRIFMPSMSDPFHENVKDEWLDQIMAAIALNPHLTVKMLTKRPERMKKYFERDFYGCVMKAFDKLPQDLVVKSPRLSYRQTWPLPNLWLGVTVENQKEADERISLLLETPAAVRFLSIEPMLNSIDFEDVPVGMFGPLRPYGGVSVETPKIDWVIIGGESGSNARPFHLEWAESIIQQCKDAGVAVFTKQTGSNAFYQGKPFKTKSRAGTDPSEWPENLRIQQFPPKN